MKNIRLLAISPYPDDTTSFYRAFGVFNDLRKQLDFNLDIQKKETYTWTDIENCDVVFMQRPYSVDHLGLVKYIREMNKPLWVDYDDNLFEISPANFMAYDTFHSEEVKKNIASIIASANVVTVSTAELKRTLGKLNENIHVVPNALNLDTFSYRDKDTKLRTKRIIWRGGSSHFLDIGEFSHEIYDAVNKFSSHEFFFMGMMPWFLDPSRANVRYFSVEDVIVYFRRLQVSAPMLLQVPLQNTHFNHCKSNIAYIEGIFAGGVVLCPDWEEWKVPGALSYKNPKEYGDLLFNVCKGKVDIEALNKIGWEYIKDTLSLSHVNKKRAEILKSLL